MSSTDWMSRSRSRSLVLAGGASAMVGLVVAVGVSLSAWVEAPHPTSTRASKAFTTQPPFLSRPVSSPAMTSVVSSISSSIVSGSTDLVVPDQTSLPVCSEYATVSMR
jgi:hypothetical protein